MKKSVKKILLLMAVIMTAMLCLVFSASAEEWGDYKYYVNDDAETVTITDYTGKSTSVKLPSKIKGKKVTALSAVFAHNEKVKSVTIPVSVTSITETFSNCKKLTSVTIGKNVKNIGDYAFYNCDALKSVKIPESVTSIGKYAFDDCGALKSVTMGKKVKTIGDYAFGSCGVLTSIKIPDSVTTINYGAFYRCYKLESVTIGKNVKTIGNNAFYNCEALESIKIPDSVTSVGDGAFSYCYKLASVTIGKSVKTICASAFYDCNALKSITIPDSVTTIGDDAFNSCDVLATVTLGKKVKKIGANAFNYCSALEKVKLPSSVKTIGENAFYNDDRYNGGVTVVLCPRGSAALTWAKKAGQPYAVSNPKGSENVIKGKVGKYSWSVDKLKGTLKLSGSGKLVDFSNANPPWYQHRYYITSISLPKGMSEVGARSFSGLKRMKSLTVPATVKIIGGSAFSGCSGLETVTISEGVTTIGGGAFQGCSALKKVTIPNTVTAIESSAFEGCSSLASIKIPSSVTSLGSSAFWGCSSLTKVTIPGSIKSTNWWWFWDCSNLKEIVFEKGVENIDTYVFDNHGANPLKVVIKNKNCNIASDCGLSYEDTIWGYKGSTAKKFADEIGAKFVDINHEHVYKNKTKKATLEKNGSVTPTCKICGATKKGTTIYYPKTVKLSETSYTYNGKVKTPSVIVKDSKGNALKKDTDYTVKYSEGRKKAGKYTVTVSFKGKYSGTKKLSFTIK